VPLVWSLARRLKRCERDRLRSLERAIDASEHERRRIAGDLHDGVVQNLAGVSFRLGAVRGLIDATTPPELTRAVDESVGETRESIRALRSLLVDIYPPSLERQGLVAALSDLMARTGDRRLTAHLHVVDGDVVLPPAIEALLFRVAQEALRNVLAHARASDVLVWLQRHPDRVELSVTDDGQGFDVDAELGTSDGHLGLVAIEDLVHELGGSMHVKSVRGGGTALRVEVPLP
jgi:signal transduction histidine kinase